MSKLKNDIIDHIIGKLPLISHDSALEAGYDGEVVSGSFNRAGFEFEMQMGLWVDERARAKAVTLIWVDDHAGEDGVYVRAKYWFE
jgi:hypothetical protein